MDNQTMDMSSDLGVRRQAKRDAALARTIDRKRRIQLSQSGVALRLPRLPPHSISPYLYEYSDR